MNDDSYLLPMLKGLVALILFCICLQCASADELDNVATRALIAAKHSPTGTRYEHGGFIAIVNPGAAEPNYRFQEPNPHGSATSVQVLDSSLLKATEKIAATYHLHLCMNHYLHHYFSSQDVVTAIISGVPEYMLDECDGTVHKFDPHVDKVHDTGADFKIDLGHCKSAWRHLPVGRIVGDINEMEPSMDNPEDADEPDCPKK